MVRGKKNSCKVPTCIAQVLKHAVMCRLSINYVGGFTVIVTFCFNEAFSLDRSQKVMRLQCWHLPFDHLVQEHKPVGLPFVL